MQTAQYLCGARHVLRGRAAIRVAQQAVVRNHQQCIGEREAVQRADHGLEFGRLICVDTLLVIGIGHGIDQVHTDIIRCRVLTTRACGR